MKIFKNHFNYFTIFEKQWNSYRKFEIILFYSFSNLEYFLITFFLLLIFSRRYKFGALFFAFAQTIKIELTREKNFHSSLGLFHLKRVVTFVNALVVDVIFLSLSPPKKIQWKIKNTTRINHLNHHSVSFKNTFFITQINSKFFSYISSGTFENRYNFKIYSPFLNYSSIKFPLNCKSPIKIFSFHS